MKFKFATFLLIAAIPSAVLAAENFLNQDPIYIVSLQDSEISQRPTQSIKNYRLVWNQEVGKFDLLPGTIQRPITIEESMNPEMIDPQPNEPIYYGTDISV